jgi:uncharacterized Zn finger protein (UPF0148 family)
MQSGRHCADCGTPLPPDGHELCIECRPTLSRKARAAGEVQRHQRQEIEKAERQIENVEILIKKMRRRLK